MRRAEERHRVKNTLNSWVEIDQKALRSNVGEFRGTLSSDCALMAVVKANAYGHGIEVVAPVVAKKADWLGVNTLEEALAERWIESDYQDRERFFESRGQRWIGIDEEALEELWARYQDRWQTSPGLGDGSSDALVALCDERLTRLS